MPTEIKQLVGAMNLDDPNEVIGKGFHRTARNMRFKGVPPNMRGEAAPGNALLTNSLLPGTGVNLTIGRFYDAINKRIIFFNYNSAGTHGIYIYNTIAGTFQRIIQVGTNTSGDPLGFSASVICSIDIIYGDSTQGDILYYIDTQLRPTKININRALSGGYGNIQRSFIDVAKEPASMPPYVVYEADPTATVNNLRKKLFKFKIRWVFDDQDKSVTSSQSEIPIPSGAFLPSIDTDPTRNCRIAIVYQTGYSNVKKIEILAAESTGNQFSDFYLIASIDKFQSAIPNNDVATYLFYNDQAYSNINVNESIQLFDYVPQTAEAQTVLNGNVLAYGNCREGYPNLLDFSNGLGQTSSMTASTAPFYWGRFYSLITATQMGESAFSSGNIHVVIRGLVFPPPINSDTYYVYFTDGTNINYPVQVGDDTAAVIEGLRVDALSKGFTIHSTGDNDLYISKASMVLAGYELQSDFDLNSISFSSQLAYDWWSKHGFGLVYFDEKGRTNGAVYTSGFSINSLGYSEALSSSGDIPKLNASIYHRPPSWASYYQWVRTKDLTKSKIIQWISDRTFKDTNAALGDDMCAYISIESLNSFIRKNPGTPLGYSFSANDRIRFIKLYNSDGTTAQLYSQQDYEILASEVNPTINGVVQSGQILKIRLPSTDGSFDFGDGFGNYFIEIYTPAQSVSNGLNIYYEYGERYTIGSPGTVNAVHEGMLQNQSANLITPATFEFTKGDFYVKRRSIQTGNIYSYSVFEGGAGDTDTVLIGMTFNSSTYNDPDIIAQSVPYESLTGSFDPGGDTRRFIRSTGNDTARIQGTIVFNFPDDVPADSWKLYLEDRYGNKTQVVAPFSAQSGAHSFPFSATINLNNNWLFLIAASVISQTRQVTFLVSNIEVTFDNTISQACIDPNFSDYYPSGVNSNGRAFLYDENAAQITFPTMYRWGLVYQEDTNINQVNRFYPENFDTIERSWGAIKRMCVWDKTLTFFQERKCAHTAIYSKLISDNSGNSQLTTTTAIITPNNVQPYVGNFGVFNQPDSVVQSQYVYYFVDPILGKILRLSKDGITDLTETYKAQTWGGDVLTKYLTDHSYNYGGTSRVTGTFNVWPDKTGEYMLVSQGGVAVDSTISGEALGFDETRNAFPSFYDFSADCILCAENDLYMWQNGIMWVMSTNAQAANYFGAQRTPSITFVFNDNIAMKKLFNTLAYQSDRTWYAPNKGDVETNTMNNQTALIQQSLIMEQDFDVLDMPNRYAAFNRNMNINGNPTQEQIALWEGEYLSGNLVIVKLSYSGGANSYIYAPYITWQQDPRNL